MAIRLSRTFILRKLHTGYACIAFGVLLLAVGLNAISSFIRPGGLLGGILS